MKTQKFWLRIVTVGIGMALLAACSPATNLPQATPTAGMALDGTHWNLVSMGKTGAEQPILSGSSVTLNFEPAGRVSGKGGCNSYSGSAAITDGTLTIGPVAATKMACQPGGIMQQEQQFFNALQTAGKYEANADRLVLHTAGGQEVLTFQRAADPTVTPQASATSAATNTAAASPTFPVVITTTPPAASATPPATSAPTKTQSPAITTTAMPGSTYLDDRSGAAELMRSYFNAINRREYLRAYSYWRNPATGAGPFDKFAAGYETTTSVDLTLGTIGRDVGAGQMYYSVPALLKAKTSDGKTQTYAACYILHLSQPAIQEPPFSGLGIERGRANVLAAGANEQTALAGACSGPDYPSGQPLGPTATAAANPIAAGVYIDNRSDPAAVVASMFNAINRKEYARAYGYWEANSNVAPYNLFKAGYDATNSVELITGPAVSDPGAGQFYFALPVVITSQQGNGVKQVVSGCYRLHMSNPGIQATPPFKPLAIQTGTLTPVQGTVDVQALLAKACQP